MAPKRYVSGKANAPLQNALLAASRNAERGFRFGELAGRRDRIDFLEPGFEKSDAIGAPLIEATGNGEPQFVFPLPRFEYFRWQKKIIERPERAAD